MARIRSLKPMFFQHDGLSALDAETHILAAGLLCYADDFGYFNANPKLIEAFVFPLRNLSVTVPEMLGSLCRIEYIRVGKCKDGRTYGQIIKFDVHQRVHNPTPSVIKDLEITWEIPEKLGNGSRENPLGIRNKEGNKEKEKDCPSNQKPKSQSKATEPYYSYPRKVGRAAAIKAIEQAAERLLHGEGESPISNYDEAITFLCQRAALFARAPAGNAGEYTPHPATWFNQSRYLDDESEWSKQGNGNGQNQREGNASLGKQADRNESNRDAILVGIFGSNAGRDAAHGSGTGQNDTDPGGNINVGPPGRRLLT